jgi:hypothetical protein
MNIPPIDIAALETVFRRMERNGVSYGLGAKAQGLAGGV